MRGKLCIAWPVKGLEIGAEVSEYPPLMKEPDPRGEDTPVCDQENEPQDGKRPASIRTPEGPERSRAQQKRRDDGQIHHHRKFVRSEDVPLCPLDHAIDASEGFTAPSHG